MMKQRTIQLTVVELQNVDDNRGFVMPDAGDLEKMANTKNQSKNDN